MIVGVARRPDGRPFPISREQSSLTVDRSVDRNKQRALSFSPIDQSVDPAQPKNYIFYF